MTPKEKAIELVDKLYQLFPLQKDVITNVGDLSCEYDNWKQAKQCALIAVDEILDATKVKWNTNRFLPNGERKNWKGIAYKKYWQEVKKEIEAL